jgi:hypothetical protein
MSKQSAVNVLKQHIQDAIEKTVVDNHYESGYKQCLIDIQNKIDDGLLQMEKEQNIDFARKCLEKAKDLDILTAFINTEQYYNETYGETKN